jgi:hypothetical protein
VKVLKLFVSPRDVLIALIGLCFEAYSTSMSYIEPGSKPREVLSDVYYPREETELPLLLLKPN